MQLIVERAALLLALQHVQGVVERRNTIPILSNLLLAAEGDRLRMTATDMDIAVADEAPSSVRQEGRTTAPAHLLYDIVRKLPEGSQLELETKEGNERLGLVCGTSSFTLNCLPTEDFPAMEEGEFPHNFQIAAPQLQRLFEKTRFAISTEETRYYLNGVYMHPMAGTEAEGGHGALRAVATDGHRLSRAETALPDGAAEMPGVIVPRKAVYEVHKLLDGFDGDVGVAASENMIRFTVADTVLIAKLVDGTFPDYERVIPRDNANIILVHGRSFASAVDRVSTISPDKSRAGKLGLEGERMVLSAQSMDQSAATEEMAVEYNGQPMDIGFNSRYVLDMTQQIDGDTMRFAIADAGSPAVAQDSDDATVLYVLMPLRV